MIPTMILFGLVFGRWWWLALAAAAVGWPALLVMAGGMPVGVGLLAASGFAVADTAVGVLVHQGVLWAIRKLRRSRGTRSGV